MFKQKQEHALNGICPYFTMFPLDFPLSILRKYASKRQWVMDPFCGRGTTNYASRVLGMSSVGIDASPVATALTEAKLANTTPGLIVRAAKRILDENASTQENPTGEFWERLYCKNVLKRICRLREELIRDCDSDTRKALRAIILGALHGPLHKTTHSYFSNQSPRTYAPKPKYAVKYWKRHKLEPPDVDVLEIIKKRAMRYYTEELTKGTGQIIIGDSRDAHIFSGLQEHKIHWIITSPPYYGMQTYIPDQWLRLWFLGGASSVTYAGEGQVEHSSPEHFASELNKVWVNAKKVSSKKATLVIRFGAINSRKNDPLAIIRKSFEDSGWQIKTIVKAGTASLGKRQVLHFSDTAEKALEEYDIWARYKSN